MYSNWFRLKWNIWNNSFSYDTRKQNNSEPQIYVTNLIEWSIDDIQIWDQIVFEEIDSKWQIQSFVWLKHFIKTNASLIKEGREDLSIYIFDNHNHALFFRYQELFNWNIKKWIKLIHIDQHTDMNENINLINSSSPVIASEAKQSLQDIFHFTNYQCNVWNFIQPAIQDWLISQVFQINTEYKLLNNDSHCKPAWRQSGNEVILNKKKIATPTICLPDRQALQHWNFILDIDLDFRHPDMWIEAYNKTIQITKNLISQASLVTIATSPYFLDQTLAIKILKDIFN